MFNIGRHWFLDMELNPQMYKNYCLRKLLAKRIAKFMPDVESAEVVSCSDIMELIKFIDQQLSKPSRSDFF